VLAIADRLGYRANRTASLLARRRTHMLGVTMKPRNAFHGELVEEVQAVADEHGYELAFGAVTRSHDERRAVETLLDFRCEALILLGLDLSPAVLSELVKGVPAVSVGRPLDLPEVDVVRADDATGMTLLVDHLVGLGHRVIAHADGGDGYIADVRRRGFQAAMHRHGLEPLVLRGGHTERHGVDAAKALDRSAGVTAIVAFNDRCAVGVLDQLDHSRIQVPKHMSVTGYDDSLLAYLQRMNLTTVSQAPVEQARLAVATAIERLDEGRTDRRVTVLEPQLVVRRSTAEAP
jgi:LacI family transcriptional regulator